MPGRARDREALAARIRELLAQGKFLTQIGRDRRVLLSKSSVHRIAAAHDFPRRRAILPPIIREAIVADLKAGRLMQVQIARKHQVAKSTVWQIRQVLLNEGLHVKVKSLRRPMACEAGHLTKFLPCVICTALAAASAQQERRQRERRTQARSPLY
jgi:hypothetical protein